MIHVIESETNKHICELIFLPSKDDLIIAYGNTYTIDKIIHKRDMSKYDMICAHCYIFVTKCESNSYAEKIDNAMIDHDKHVEEMMEKYGNSMMKEFYQKHKLP